MSTRRRKKKKKTSIVNKTRFTIFCLLVALVLIFIFLKIFMPALNRNLTTNRGPGAAGDANAAPVQTEYQESTEDRDEENEGRASERQTEDKEKSEENRTRPNDRSPGVMARAEDKETEYPKDRFDDTLDSVQGDFVYYNQTDIRWGNKTFGPEDPIWSHGCGPAAMASIVTSLTDEDLDPEEMSDWAYEHGYHAPNAGSMHALIPEAARAFGLNAEGMYYPSEDQLAQALRDGKYVVMVSGHGTFSDEDGHFITLINIDENNRVEIADSLRYQHIHRKWTLEEILAEASPVSAAGGPFWAIWPDTVSDQTQTPSGQ